MKLIIGLDRINELFWIDDLRLFHYESYLFSDQHREEQTPFEYNKYLPHPLSLMDIHVKNNFLINTDFIISTIALFFAGLLLFYLCYYFFIFVRFLYRKIKKKKIVIVESENEESDEEEEDEKEEQRPKMKRSVISIMVNKFLFGFLDRSLFAVFIYGVMQLNAQKIENRLFIVSFSMSITIMIIYGIFVIFQWFVSFWAIDLTNVNHFRHKIENYEPPLSDEEIILKGGITLEEASDKETQKYEKKKKIKEGIAGLFTTLYFDLYIGKIFNLRNKKKHEKNYANQRKTKRSHKRAKPFYGRAITIERQL